MKTLPVIDYLIIFVSLLASVAVGVFFARKGQKSTKKYFAAEGKLPAWAIGMSIMATLISSITFLAYPGEGFSTNWIRLVQGIMVPVVLIFLIWVIVPLYRKVIGISAYEYFERRFGYFARLYSSLGFVMAHFSKMGTVFYLLSLAISAMTGIDTLTVLWAMGVIVILVTLLGGIEAVIWLDTIQGFLLIAGGIVSLLIILFSVEGGAVEVWNIAKENGRIGFGPFNWDFVNLTFWVMAINGIFYAIQKYGTDQTIVQRYLTARSDRDAIKSSLMGVLLSVPVWALFMFIGTALFSYYQSGADVLPANLKAEEVFPYFIMTKMPVGITGLVISALIAAAISSLDSDLNCLSAVGVEDFYAKLKPNATDKMKLRMGKITVIIAGIAALLVGSLYTILEGEGVLGIVFTLYAIFSGGIAGIFLAGLFIKRIGRKSLYVGIGACVMFTAYAVLTSTKIGTGAEAGLILDLGKWNYSHHPYMLGVYSHLVLMAVAYVASFFTREDAGDETLTIYPWLRNLKSRNWLKNK